MTSIREAKKAGIPFDKKVALQSKFRANLEKSGIEMMEVIIKPEITLEQLESIHIDHAYHGDIRLITGKTPKNIMDANLPSHTFSDFIFDRHIIEGYSIPQNLSIPTSWLQPAPEKK